MHYFTCFFQYILVNIYWNNQLIGNWIQLYWNDCILGNIFDFIILEISLATVEVVAIIFYYTLINLYLVSETAK